MKLKFKMEYLKKIYQRYHKSPKKEKNKILNEFCKVCEYHRKHAIRILNGIPPGDCKTSYHRKQNFKYLHQTISTLEYIWESANYPWSEKLKALIPIWLPKLKQQMPISDDIEKQLLSISPSTIDRRLKKKKYQIRKRIYSTTKPGYLLKNQIPIKTDCWDVNKPGFIEVDLVAHCGNSLDGDFIYSLNCTDICTTWTETRAIMGKGQFATFQALKGIISSFPFQIKGIDSDNGSEFINWHLAKFCKDNNIQFTRSRPYKKDDNAHIEQKNWTHVRKIFGYARYDSEQALISMNNLYSNELRYFQNLFQPAVKLIQKVQGGSKLKRKYDKPLTPFQRLYKCKYYDTNKFVALNDMFNKLNPFELSQTIDKKVNDIYRMRTVRIKILKTFEARFYNEIKNDFSQYKYS